MQVYLAIYPKGPPAGYNPPSACGESEFVVMRLIDKLHPLKHELFFDNYFASPELMHYLKKEKAIWAVSTLNKKRSRKCHIPTEKEMKEGGRGTSEEFVDSSGSIVVAAWYDNKEVLTLSNYVGKDTIGKCNHYDKSQKKRIVIDRPNSVAIYNKFMGGVDKADMLLSRYRTKYRSRKWYHRLAFHLLSLAAINSWTIYRQIGGHETLVKFLGKICFSLIKGEVSDYVFRSMRRGDVSDVIKYDKMNHWPVILDIPHSQRCKFEICKKKTKYQCSKCKVFLCITNNICFRGHHGVPVERIEI